MEVRLKRKKNQNKSINQNQMAKVKTEGKGYIKGCGSVLNYLTDPKRVGLEESVVLLGPDLKTAKSKVKNGGVDSDDGDVVYEITIKRIGTISYGFQEDETATKKKK